MKIKPTNDFEKKKILESLFDQYFNCLVVHASKYIKSYAEAEEIVQDIFVKVWNEMNNFPDDINYKAYLFRSVQNSCFNYIKHKKVIEKHKKHTAYSQNFFDNQEEPEIYEAVDKAINELPEKCYEIFVMSRFEELKYHEIADTLGISQKTVEKYMTKSLKLLKEKLKDFIPVIFFLF